MSPSKDLKDLRQALLEVLDGANVKGIAEEYVDKDSNDFNTNLSK